MSRNSLHQYALDRMLTLGQPEKRPVPEKVRRFEEEYTRYCRNRAIDEYARTGQWFYCPDHHEFSEVYRWDEVVTWRVFWQLIKALGGIEKLPDYSLENHQKAVAFWQGWQRPDGEFFNPATGKTGSEKDGSGINGKYVPAVLELLGAQPLHSTSGYGATAINLSELLAQCADHKKGWGMTTLNHGLGKVAVLFQRIHEGETDLIPTVERCIELALSGWNAETGLFDVNPETVPGDFWSNYHATAACFKGLNRLLSAMGAENFPLRRQRADTLLKHQQEFRSDQAYIGVIRNTIEMFTQSLMESDYRQEELRQALAEHALALLRGEPWNIEEGDYITYSLLMLGAFLQWEGYDPVMERKSHPAPCDEGAAYDYRLVIGPYGRCANIIPKADYEKADHPDFNYAKCGLRARNAVHEKKPVREIAPPSDAWTESRDEKGGLVLTREFDLTEIPREPWLKIKWTGGDVDIHVNGVFVRRKLDGMPETGAVQIPTQAAATLKPGRNTLSLHFASDQPSSRPLAGLLDWTELEKDSHASPLR